MEIEPYCEAEVGVVQRKNVVQQVVMFRIRRSERSRMDFACSVRSRRRHDELVGIEK